MEVKNVFHRWSEFNVRFQHTESNKSSEYPAKLQYVLEQDSLFVFPWWAAVEEY